MVELPPQGASPFNQRELETELSKALKNSTNNEAEISDNIEGPTEQAGVQNSASGPVYHADKTGRNEPCPCGSGLKYKNCCGKNL